MQESPQIAQLRVYTDNKQAPSQLFYELTINGRGVYVQGEAPELFSRIVEVDRSLRDEMNRVISETRSLTLGEKRRRLSEVMKLRGYALAESFFQPDDHEAIVNVLTAADVLAVLEAAPTRLAYEMMFVTPRDQGGGGELGRFLADLSMVIRIPSKIVKDSDLRRKKEVNLSKRLAIRGPNVPVGRGKKGAFAFEDFPNLEDAFRNVADKELVCVVAHRGNEQSSGIRMTHDGEIYDKQQAGFRRFARDALVLLLSCESHKSGIVNTVTSHSAATVIGSSTNLVSNDTCRLAQHIGRMMTKKTDTMLIDLWRDWQRSDDSVFMKLLAIRGDWDILLKGAT